VLWELYILLTQIEAAFRTLKSELGLRPIYHQVEKRVEAHIFVGGKGVRNLFPTPFSPSTRRAGNWARRLPSAPKKG
jgi:hypothetical protein